MSNFVSVFDVGPRDGLQNEAQVLSASVKVRFISGLIEAGIQDVEWGAFVRPDRVPQMADTDRVCALLQKKTANLKKARGWCLVPNQKGLERAIQSGISNIAVFTGASESFTRNNIGMGVQESLNEFKKVISTARQEFKGRLRVRGYLSTAFGCPFEGKVKPAQALRVIEKLKELGVHSISIGDTIGVATPKNVDALVQPALKLLGVKRTAVHFHDTRGMALANTLRALELGVRIIDSSAGGLGGCPFAPSSSGNLPTEDLVYMLNGMGMKTGIDLRKLCSTSLWLAKHMKKPLASKILQVFQGQCDQSNSSAQFRL